MANRTVESTSEAEHNGTSQRSQSLRSFQHQEALHQQDEDQVKESGNITTTSRTDTALEQRIPQHPDLDVVHTPTLSIVTNSPHVQTDSPMSWGMISPGLQLYIFDCLISQFRLPEFVGEVLGLNATELKDLVTLKCERSRQPSSSDDLWDYCRLIRDPTVPFVDPTVLKGYLDYFAFISRFEDQTLLQRRVAVMYLRQRRIEGAFVDMLLPKASGIWRRPEPAQPDRSNREASWTTGVSHDEAQWNSFLSGTFIHGSHNLEKITETFKSSYFPQDYRKALLAIPLWELDPLGRWLVYGIGLSASLSAEFVKDFFSKNQPTPNVNLSAEILSLWKCFENFTCRGAGIHTSDTYVSQLHSVLYSLVKYRSYLDLLRHELKASALGQEGRQILYQSAKQRANVILEEELMTAVSDEGQGQAASVGASHVEGAPGFVGPACTSGAIDRSRNAAMLSDNRNDQENFNNISPQSSGRSHPLQISTTTVIQGTADNTTGAMSNGTRWLPARSPSPPPWSPVTDEGNQAADVSSLPILSQSQVFVDEHRVHSQFLAPQKDTPWSSKNITLQKPPIIHAISPMDTVTVPE